MDNKRYLILFYALLLALLASGVYVVLLLAENSDEIDAAEKRRYDSYQLADELRQSSDDLTRMARTYAVTGEARYADYFAQILDIRNGQVARPLNYGGIYWDYISATGDKPRADGEKASLKELMRRMDFSPGEFDLLQRAQFLSDELVALEERAMNAMQGIFADSSGAYVLRAEPDLNMARQLLHGKEYHRAKAEIMAPIEQFFARVDVRTADQVADLQDAGRRLRYLLLVVISTTALLVFGVLLRFSRSVIHSEGNDSSVADNFAIKLKSISEVGPFLMAAVVVAIIVTAASWMMQDYIEEQWREEIGNELSSILDSNERTLQAWFTQVEDETRVWAQMPELRRYSKAIQGGDEDAGEREALVSHFEPLLHGRGYEGFLIATPEGKVSLNYMGELGTQEMSGEFLARLRTGREYSAVVLPRLLNRGAEEVAAMFSGAAIRGEDGRVQALLILQINPEKEFTDILQRGRVGESGESYAFNLDGQLISDSRFDDHLRQIGLVGEDERGILRIEIRDPGGNMVTGHQPSVPRRELPFTLMADRALRYQDGINLEGYNDYRGVPVIGAWEWNEKLGMGLATEVDVAEAYDSMYTSRKLVMVSTLFTVCLVFGLTGLFSWNKLRAAVVNARIRGEEERFRSLLEAAPDAMILADDSGEITLVNQMTELMFGYSRGELVGQKVEMLIPSRWHAGHVGLRDGYLGEEDQTRRMGMGRDLFAVGKDGVEFPVEISLSSQEVEGRMTVVAAVRDISERKHQEQVAQALQVLRQAVWRLDSTSAAGDLISVLGENLDSLNIPYETMGINLVDISVEPADVYMNNLENGKFIRKLMQRPELAAAVVEFWRGQKTVYRPDMFADSEFDEGGAGP